MNERIKELIAEAVKFRLDPDSNAYEAQVSPEDLEFLVELVVRECAEVVDAGKGRAQPADLYEYFGVKE